MCPMTKNVKTHGKNCETILRKFDITEYQIGKSKVSLSFMHLFYNNKSNIWPARFFNCAINKTKKALFLNQKLNFVMLRITAMKMKCQFYFLTFPW